MIKLEGTILNVFTQQGGKDRKTGDQFEDRDKVQILGAMELPNGGVKNELFTLSVENSRDFKDFINQKITIAVGAMASGRNVIFTLQSAFTCFSAGIRFVKKNSELAKRLAVFYLLDTIN